MRVSCQINELLSQIKEGKKLGNDKMYTVCVFDDGSFKMKNIEEIYNLADLK